MFKDKKRIKELETLLSERTDDVLELTDEKERLVARFESFEKKKTPEAVIEKLLKRKISYYNILGLPEESRSEYMIEARTLLESDVLKNEVSHLIADWVKHIAANSEDFENVTGMRMSINALQLLMERLEELVPDKNIVKKENLHSNT